MCPSCSVAAEEGLKFGSTAVPTGEHLCGTSISWKCVFILSFTCRSGRREFRMKPQRNVKLENSFSLLGSSFAWDNWKISKKKSSSVLRGRSEQMSDDEKDMNVEDRGDILLYQASGVSSVLTTICLPLDFSRRCWNSFTPAGVTN